MRTHPKNDDLCEFDSLCLSLCVAQGHGVWDGYAICQFQQKINLGFSLFTLAGSSSLLVTTSPEPYWTEPNWSFNWFTI